jgi:hypothetical protein
MNSARTLGPALAGNHWNDWWAHVLEPPNPTEGK